MLTTFDLPKWKKDKFKQPITNYKTKQYELVFSEKPEFLMKFPEFKKSFSDLDEKSFYFNALQFMVPRTQLLYDAKLR